MKSLRERMQKGLSISIGKKSSVTCAPRTMNDNKKSIIDMGEPEFKMRYLLQRQVMESCHEGMLVLFATRLEDRSEVVIKIRNKRTSFHSAAEEREWRATMELQLNMPKTSTICQLIEVIATNKNYYVVMEKVEGQDLCELLQVERVSQSEAREVVYQILVALKHLHAQGRIHKDLKLENVMVDMNACKEPESPGGRASLRERSPSPESDKPDSEPKSPGVKIIDFDTVESWEPGTPKARDVLGSDGYIAPEAYMGDYSPASDIFCVGVIMYRLLIGKFPYSLDLFDDGPGENWVGSPAMQRIYERLKKTRIDFKHALFEDFPEAAELCSGMLKFDFTQRPSAEQALQSVWFLQTDLQLHSATHTPPAKFEMQVSPGGLPNAFQG